MKTYLNALHLLGIRGCEEIPLSILLSGTLLPGAYDISDENVNRLNAMHDIIREYNRKNSRKRQIRGSLDVAETMLPKMKDLDHEELWAIFLTNSNGVLDIQRITVGSLSQTIIDNRRIVKMALTCNAGGIVIVHNHPSGDPKPSGADIKMTEKLKNAAEQFDIQVLDHVIMARERFYSFAEEEFHNL